MIWGTPGTLLAAQAMHGWTADERWRAWNESAEALLSRRDEEGYWTQRLYGQEVRGGLTPPHGLVGNVQALLPLLDGARADALKREAAALLAGHAVRADGLANWPPGPRPELPGPDGQIRVQWCAGAPGIVIGAATYLDEELLRRRRAGVAHRPSWSGEGTGHLSRHRRQRVRVPQGLRANGRRAMARARATFRDARARASRTAPRRARSRPLLVVDRRHRRGALRG